ncbi:MAG: flagellar protein FlgN [Bacillota bacterium]|nr:flagellar protein FlgN [Bacillota bacterium]
MDRSLITSLIGVLEAHEEVYGDLLSLGRRQKELVMKGDLPGLEALLEVQQALVHRAGHLEGERSQVTDGLARSWGIPVESLSLTRIQERCQENSWPEAARLGELRTSLERLVVDLHEVNQENERLLKRALALVRHTLDLVLPMEASPGYSSKGHRRRDVPRAVDRHA